ncbi:MAG TPA: trypsin-like peptidase domain-containing protein [Thermoanaerobaculia bacterium]|nr:trypsin-like peptidase domain-containing protein [Thermoanaerobaculia bacterium]
MELNGRGRGVVTLLLVLGAVVFGMVVAGSLNLSMPALGSPATAPANLPSGEDGPQRLAGAPAAIPSFADLAEVVTPAVVQVLSTTIEEASDELPQDIFDFFRQRPPGRDGEPREFRQDGGGSGFIVSPDGWIVTNNHVVDGATTVRVRLAEREYEAAVRGVDDLTDIALLKVELDRPLPYLELGDSSSLRVGEWVMVIGSPLALESSVTVGVVSAKGRALVGLNADNSFDNFIQTDAAINRGNSGGPLVNTQGEVIGIATAMNFGAENIGFAIPVDTLRHVLPQLRDEGRVQRGYLGVAIENLDYQDAQAWGLESTNGALVNSVTEGTPAAKAGLQPGDIILEVGDHEVERTRDLIDEVSSYRPGTELDLELWRNGKRVSKTVTLEERTPTVADVPEPEETGEESFEWLGIEVEDITEELRRSVRLPRDLQGVLISDVHASSPLYDEGVRPGFVISDVNGAKIGSVADLEAELEQFESGDYVRLYVQIPAPTGLVSRFAIVRVP